MFLKHYLLCITLVFVGCSNPTAVPHKSSNQPVATEMKDDHKHELLGIKMAVWRGAAQKAVAAGHGVLGVNKNGCLVIKGIDSKDDLLPVFGASEAWLVAPPVWWEYQQPLLVDLNSQKIYFIGDKFTWGGGSITIDEALKLPDAKIPDCGVKQLDLL